MKRVYMLFIALLLVPIVSAVIGEGETYKVRHSPDYDRFINVFEPYKADFIQKLRADKQTIYDARLRKTFVIESVNDDWLMEILFDKQSRNWNHIQLPPEVLATGFGIQAEYVDQPMSINSGTSLYPSYTKPRGGGTFTANRADYLDQAGLQVTPEEIAWIRLNTYSVLNPVTHRNVRTTTLTDEQIKDYLVSRKTRKIVDITPEKAQKELRTLAAYYKLHNQRFMLD